MSGCLELYKTGLPVRNCVESMGTINTDYYQVSIYLCDDARKSGS